VYGNRRNDLSIHFVENMNQGLPSRTAIALGLLTVYLVWGSTYLAIRIAVETLPPFLMASARFLTAGIVLATYLKLTGQFAANRRQWMQGAAIGACLLLGGNGLVSWSEQAVPSGIATLIVSLNPLFTVLGDWIVAGIFKDGRRGSKPDWLVFVGIGLGLFGLVLLVGPALTAQDSTHLDLVRVLALVAACVFWCIGSLLTRYLSAPAEPASGAAVQMITGGVWLLLVSTCLGEPSHFHIDQVSVQSMLAWLYLVVLGSLVAFTTFVWLMKHTSPALVSTYAYVNPIVAVFLGWFILGEMVSSRIFIAAAVIVAGVAAITISRGRQRV
jgi:drug/metabolite transporter (DMT)-like permease